MKDRFESSSRSDPNEEARIIKLEESIGFLQHESDQLRSHLAALDRLISTLNRKIDTLERRLTSAEQSHSSASDIAAAQSSGEHERGTGSLDESGRVD